MKELVFNFSRYEPEIRKYGIRHQSMSYFFEFLKSILLGELKKSIQLLVIMLELKIQQIMIKMNLIN